MVLLLQNVLQRLTTGALNQFITYFDELTEAALLLYLIFTALHGFTLNSHEKKIFVFYCVYIVITIISSFSGYAGIGTIILDCFVCMKFMIYYWGGMELSKKRVLDGKKAYACLNTLCKILSVFLFVLSLHDLFMTPFFEKYDYRFFTYSLELCFQHPTYLAAFCVTCMAVLAYGMKYDKGNLKYIVLLSVVTCLTFRTKAIVAIVVIWAIYFSSVKYKLPVKGIVLVFIACIAVYLGMGQIESYYTVGTSVPIRLKLLQDGISIAQNHFPLGAGFGSFGTTVAYESGSAFYYSLGYMTGYYKGQPIGDGFWPGVFAESGWIGSIFFIIVIAMMFIDSFKRLSQDKFAGWCMLSILFYAIIASTAETAFFNPATAFMFIIYGIVANRKNDESETDYERVECVDSKTK